FSMLGAEPLAASFSYDLFQKQLDGTSATVKGFLLNQQRIAGIGNIYADEICFAARIAPSCKSASLTTSEKKRLFTAIPRVLRRAIRHGGTTFRDYRDTQGKKGNFTHLLKVYGRAGKPCRRCGRTLVRTTIASRGTVSCPGCQI
ncbi:MAG: Fpg/Nei family DNA glycosylase, partial [Acidobacteriota bacterium]